MLSYISDVERDRQHFDNLVDQNRFSGVEIPLNQSELFQFECRHEREHGSLQLGGPNGLGTVTQILATVRVSGAQRFNVDFVPDVASGTK